MKHLLAVCVILLLLSPGCSKESGKHCWGAVDGLGNDVTFNPQPCGITKKEMEEKYPNWWIYNADEPKYCWREQYPNGTFYGINLAEAVVQRRAQLIPGYTASKIDCGSFCNLTWHERTKSKTTGQYGCCIKVIKEALFNPDSCSKLFTGRVITVSETADSITTREVFEKKP